MNEQARVRHTVAGAAVDHRTSRASPAGELFRWTSEIVKAVRHLHTAGRITPNYPPIWQTLQHHAGNCMLEADVEALLGIKVSSPIALPLDDYVLRTYLNPTKAR